MAKKNPYLKSANQEVEYDYKQIQELKRCFQDPVHFIREYVRIVHPTKGTVPFDLYDYQENMIRAFHEERYSIVLSARQTGKCVTGDTKVKVLNKKLPWIKKTLLRLVDNDTYARLYS